MKTHMTAIEVKGRITEQNMLQLDEPLPIQGPRPVRVILMYYPDEEWDETEWLMAAAANPVFDFLNDPAEDVYSPADGRPFSDEV